LNRTPRPALTRRSLTLTSRVAITALLVAAFAVVGLAPAQAAGGGRYTSLTDDSNGSVGIKGFGIDGQYLERTLSPGGRTNAEGFSRVSSWQIGARTSVAITCFRWSGTSWTKVFESTETNASTSNGLIYEACQESDRMDLRVRVYR